MDLSIDYRSSGPVIVYDDDLPDGDPVNQSAVSAPPGGSVQDIRPAFPNFRNSAFDAFANGSAVIAWAIRWAALVSLTLTIAFAVHASEKKGVGLADVHAAARLRALNVAWYYTWKPYPINGATREEFVPMVWGGHRASAEIGAVRRRGRVPILLAINEPNGRDQANMSVEQVIHLWPQISALTDKVSCPAPAGRAGVFGAWFDRFYRMAKARDMDCDFMAVHVYGPPDPKLFLARIDTIYAKYGKPIWITEFAVADWTAKKTGKNRYPAWKVLEFMKAVLPELEKRPFVERYAWFGAGKHSLSHPQVYTSRLFDKNGALTELGKFYARFQADSIQEDDGDDQSIGEDFFRWSSAFARVLGVDRQTERAAQPLSDRDYAAFRKQLSLR